MFFHEKEYKKRKREKLMKKVKEKILSSVQSSPSTSKSTSTGLTELLHSMTIEGRCNFIMALALNLLSCLWSQYYNCVWPQSYNMPNNAAKTASKSVFIAAIEEDECISLKAFLVIMICLSLVKSASFLLICI